MGGLRFEHIPHESNPGAATLNAYNHEDKFLGQLSWEPDGEVDGVMVWPEFQRQGIATALWNQGRQLHPNLHHAPESAQTDDGKAWAKKVGVVQTARVGALEIVCHDVHPDMPEDSYAVSAYMGHRPVGRLRWYPDNGELHQIEVHPHYRRLGIASALFDWARINAEPRLHHSSAMTDAGRRWAASMGYAPQEYTRVPEAVGALWRTSALSFEEFEDRMGHLYPDTQAEYQKYLDRQPPPNPTKLYRGLSLSSDQMPEGLSDLMESDPGHPNLPGALIDHMMSANFSRFGPEAGGGIGHFWATERPHAENFARRQNDFYGHDWEVVLNADYGDKGPEPAPRGGGTLDPLEHQLRPGQHIPLSHIDYRHPGEDWTSIPISPGGRRTTASGGVADNWRTAMGARGPLPEDITFQHHPQGSAPFPDVIDPQHMVDPGGFPAVSAHVGDQMVGHIQWHSDHPRKKGEIWDTRVHPDWQRRGVADALFDWTTDKIEPDLHHSDNLSDEGAAWRSNEEQRPIAIERDEAWRRGDPLPKRFAAWRTADWQDTVGIPEDNVPAACYGYWCAAGKRNPFDLDTAAEYVSGFGEWADAKPIHDWIRPHLAAVDSEGDSFPSEDHVTNDDLRKIFEDTDFLSQKRKGVNRGAADFYHMDDDQRMGHFNDHVIPLWQEHGMPRPGKGRYLDFMESLADSWRGGDHLARLAMPAPLPEDITFRYHPTDDSIPSFIHAVMPCKAPAVTAWRGSEPVGTLEWYPGGEYKGRPGGRRGEIAYVDVPLEEQGQSIASGMFDHARKFVPEVHHSDRLTSQGRSWRDYEQSRNKVQQARIAMPTYYHFTEDSDFTPDPHHRPWDVMNESQVADKPGLYVSRSPGMWSFDRPYRAELDGPEPENEHLGETFIPGDRLHQYKVKVLPWREAMPRPLPSDVTFMYHPTDEHIPESMDATMPILAPAVSAWQRGKPVGTLEWAPYDPDDEYASPHGEISMIRVPEKHQGQSIASGMLDHARKFVPQVHHSENLTPDGAGWSEYERSRSRVEAAFRRLAAAGFDPQEVTNRLKNEFDEWAGPRGAKAGIGPYPRNLVTHWPYVEKFMKERYPAAYQGHDMGHEEATPALDAGNYPTGPEAVAQHGYDPAEIAAGMLLLHNGHRATGEPGGIDQQRLVDIYHKRQQMQRAYEQRQAFRITAALDLEAAVNQGLVDRLHGEFHDWAGKQAVPPESDGKRGPIGLWRNVEDFLKRNYPAAHRGHMMGREQASQVLDNRKPSKWGVGDTAPYETGPEAVAQHGYDPSEIAAGMVLLHNKSHPFRGDMAQEDQDRLVNIFDKRQQMQRDYEQRNKVQAFRAVSSSPYVHPDVVFPPPRTLADGRVNQSLGKGRVPIVDLLSPHGDMEGVLHDVKNGILSETPDDPVYLKPHNDYPGKLEIADGHHRVAEALLRGETHVNAAVEDQPDEDPYGPPFYDFAKYHPHLRHSRNAFRSKAFV